MIAVHAVGYSSEVPSAVPRHRQPAAERVDSLRVVRINADIAVVERPEVDVRIVVDHPPALAAIVRAEQIPFGFGLGDQVNGHRIAAGDGNSNSIHRRLRQSIGQLLPRYPAVDRLVERSLAAARVEAPRLAAESVNSGINDSGVLRIEIDIRAAAVLVSEQR